MKLIGLAIPGEAGVYPFFAPEKEDQVIILPSSCICWFVFNTEYPLFQNSKLRQAFAYAIQRAQDYC